MPVALTDSLSALSALPPTEADTGAPLPVAEPLAQTGWWRRKLGLAFTSLGILFVALMLIHYFGIKSAKARMSATVTPIRSIVIQKEGAIDPLDEGFKLHAHEDPRYPQVLYNRETNGWDRWRIVTNDQYYYYRSLSVEEKDFALQRDWRLTCICALESGGGFADVDFAGKGPRFDIGFMQEGDRYFVGLPKQISPKIELDAKIEFAGVADVAHPHTYELRYDHVSRTASLWIDGDQKASGYRGHHQFQEDRGLFFGAELYGNVSTGSAVFRRVQFQAE